MGTVAITMAIVITVGEDNSRVHTKPSHDVGFSYVMWGLLHVENTAVLVQTSYFFPEIVGEHLKR